MGVVVRRLIVVKGGKRKERLVLGLIEKGEFVKKVVLKKEMV